MGAHWYRFEEAGEDDDDNEPSHHSKIKFYESNGFPERVVIIGSGPAGLAAAIYAARAGLKPVVVAPPVGGQLQGKGVMVENYPAVTGVTGPSIVFDMMEQAAEFGTVFLQNEVSPPSHPLFPSCALPCLARLVTPPQPPHAC